MNQLSVDRRARILAALVDGNSIRATCRITGTAKGTVLKLLAEIGKACKTYQDAHLRGLRSRRIECDEIWSFCYAKERNLSPEMQGQLGFGDVWTWTAIDADTKLVPSWLLGNRDYETGRRFMMDLASRLATRVQLTTDGLRAYLMAVEDAFGWNGIDYSVLEKVYGQSPEGTRRYSPPVCIGAEKRWVMGNPDPDHVSTSYVERQNLTMRMSMRRFTRLTNGFSKKLANLEHAVALHFMHYNFARPHATLTKAAGGIHTTPAMAAGVADHVWTVEEIAGLISN